MKGKAIGWFVVFVVGMSLFAGCIDFGSEDNGGETYGPMTMHEFLSDVDWDKYVDENQTNPFRTYEVGDTIKIEDTISDITGRETSYGIMTFLTFEATTEQDGETKAFPAIYSVNEDLTDEYDVGDEHSFTLKVVKIEIDDDSFVWYDSMASLLMWVSSFSYSSDQTIVMNQVFSHSGEMKLELDVVEGFAYPLEEFTLELLDHKGNTVDELDIGTGSESDKGYLRFTGDGDGELSDGDIIVVDIPSTSSIHVIETYNLNLMSGEDEEDSVGITNWYKGPFYLESEKTASPSSGGSMTAQKSAKGSGTGINGYNVTLNVASTSGTFRIADTAVVIEDDAGITVASADFSTKSTYDDTMGNAEVYIIDGGTNQNITIVDNDANGNLNANDKVWIESGLAQPGYTIIVKVSGSQVGTWDA